MTMRLICVLARPEAKGVARLLISLPPFVAVAAPSRRHWCSGIAQGTDDARGLPSAFPWREAPSHRVEGFLKRVGYFLQQRKHRKFDCINNDSFLPGAEMAFVQVAAGAFQMRACQVVNPLFEEGQDIRPSESGQTGGITPFDLPEEGIVDPQEVMQQDLAEFYVQATASTKIARCTPFYRLHEMHGSKITNVNVMYGARRGDVPNEEDVREFMGTKMAWDSLSKDLEALMRYRFLRDKDMVKTRLSSIRKTTLQVDVDILCCETFFVTDDRTEQVVQGCKAVGLRTHRLRLECSPFLRRDFHWEAVDLDNWMKGNAFW